MTDSEQTALIKADEDIAAAQKKLAAQNTEADGTTTPQATASWWTTSDAMTVSASVLVFGVFICCLVTILLKSGKSADDVLKGIGTILIILVAVFLVVAGYDDKQIAPVIGLLGTIAGYILGRNSRDEK